ncbi:MAG: ABC transporter ATP-binding protein/permease [Clostridiales bacterium]|jgi:ATP-binding cassette subfamily B protein|nr:ABC transporter ATP-binding protein/permease [Clostridiales bacterium]
MKSILKFTKPFTWLLIIAFALLFTQAMCDLYLPDKMSQIVNVGIMQNGIEHATPTVITREGLATYLTQMDSKERDLVISSYDLKLPTDLEQYGKITAAPKFSDSFYAINVNDKQTYQELDDIFVNISSNLAKANNPTLDLSEETAKVKTALDFADSEYQKLGLDTSHRTISYIINIGLFMLLIALIGGSAALTVDYMSARISSGIARNLRTALYKKVDDFSNVEMDKFSTASLITRSTNDITQIQMILLFAIRFICYAPIMVIGGLIMAIGKAPSMSWIIGMTCIILLILISIIFHFAMPKFKILQKLIDRLNLVVREHLTGLMVIKAFGTRSFERERFRQSNRNLADTNLYVMRLMALFMPLMMLSMNAISLCVIWNGGHLVSQGEIQVGDMMAFLQYAIFVFFSFVQLSMVFIMMPRAAVSAERISEVLNTQISIIEPSTDAEFIPEHLGELEFKDVSFKYGEASECVINNISFVAKRAETTAIIGATGSGKTTIANLALRFYDVTSGEIKVNGVNINSLKLSTLRDQIAFVPQKGSLFFGTIADNLRLGKKNATDEEMQEKAEISQATEFINSKQKKYNAEIAQSGKNVSGGQKQRLCIARALVKNARINIFDDSFSALDYKTDSKLRASLEQKMSEATNIIIAQRVSTIMNAEQILVLDEGAIVGKGTHHELLETCEAYREIVSSQLTKEEMNA